MAGYNHLEKETWLRALAVVRNGVIVTDPNLPDNPIIYANPAFEALTGYRFEEVVGRNCRFLQGEDRRQPGLDAMRAAIAGGSECRTVLRNFKKDGTPFWNKLTVAPVHDGAGNVIAFVGVQEDVTELREAGEHASRYAAIIEAATDFVATADAGGRVIFVNRAGRRLLGIGDAEDLRGVSIYDYYPEGARGAVVEEAIPAAVRGGSWSGETALLSREGRKIPVSQVILAHRGSGGELEYLSTIAKDISDGKGAEEALREGEQHLRDVLDGLAAFVCVLAPDGTILEGNRAAQGAVGRSLHEVRGESFPEVPWWSHSPETRARVAEALRRCVLDESSRFDAEMMLAEGRIISVDLSFTPLFGPGGEVGHLVVSAMDITERKRAEQEVQRRTHQQAAVARLGMRALAETDLSSLMDEAVAVLARTLSVEYCKVLKLLPGDQELLLRAGTGWRPGLVGRATEGTGLDSQAGYTLRSDAPVIAEDLRAETRFSPSLLLREHGAVSGISTVIPGRQGPFGVLGAHTRERRTFTENDLNVLQAVANVIAAAVERKQAEEKMRDVRGAERLRIARDIHDEALQDIVHALAEVELMRDASGAGARGLSGALRRSIEGLRAAIFDLRLGEDRDRTFAEQLETLVQLNRRYSPELEVELRADPDLPAELGKNAETELLHILQEALANVRRHSGAGRASVAVWASEEALWTEVFDDGRGFDGSAQHPGAGIKGMRERAHALGGNLDVRSEPGGGTIVRFELPLGGKRDEPQEVRILLVEDHASFRQAAASVLEKAPGFSVVGQAGSLSEARRILATTRKVDVAILDLGLPDGYGADLIGDLRASNPRAQALALSAAFDRAEVARAVESGAAGVLHKSVQMSEVVDAARRLRAGETLLPLEEVVELLRFAGARKEREYELGRAIERLTPREREVLRALAEGLDSEEIAERLNISVKTERNHISSIFAKLGVHSRLQALVFAARHGLVDLG